MIIEEAVIDTTPDELIIVANPEKIRATPDGKIEALDLSDTDAQNLVSDINDILSDGARIETLFGVTEEYLKSEAEELASKDVIVPDLSIYYNVIVEGRNFQDIADRLNAKEEVKQEEIIEEGGNRKFRYLLDSVYTKPKTTLPRGVPISAPAKTKDYKPMQGYIGKAPEGINVNAIYGKPGGKGAGVNIVDVELGWNFSHEDFENNKGLFFGLNDPGHENHGTAVMGVLCAGHNGYGINGICPDANVHAYSVHGIPSARGIYKALRYLRRHGNPGDIILLELERTGPAKSYIPIEWWPEEFDAIQFATLCGMIVVEAGGNGCEDLDDPIYDSPMLSDLSKLPREWRNPFNINNPSSGAILVGAGNPPSGTQGYQQPQEIYEDRARCGFSNYGARFDAQGWGWEVATTGCGDIDQKNTPRNKNQWYTKSFNGTSSAAPIVAGALACIQGMLRASGKMPLSPQKAKRLLRETGSLQVDYKDINNQYPSRPATQNIGKRPNLAEMIESPIIKNQPPFKLIPSTPFPPRPKHCKPQVTEIIIRCGSPNSVVQLRNKPYQPPIEDDSTPLVIQNNPKMQQLADITGNSPDLLVSQLELDGITKVLSKEIEKIAIERGIIKK